MTTSQKIIRNKVGLLELGKQLGNDYSVRNIDPTARRHNVHTFMHRPTNNP